MAEHAKILTNRYGLPQSHTLKVAEEHGVYATARRVFTAMQPADIAAQVKDANMRGRGGIHLRCLVNIVTNPQHFPNRLLQFRPFEIGRRKVNPAPICVGVVVIQPISP